jgi:hypothetical protein
MYKENATTSDLEAEDLALLNSVRNTIIFDPIEPFAVSDEGWLNGLPIDYIRRLRSPVCPPHPTYTGNSSYSLGITFNKNHFILFHKLSMTACSFSHFKNFQTLWSLFV